MWRFSISARVDPQTLPRLVGGFAQRAIVPHEMTMQIAGDTMRVDVAVSDLPPAQANVIAAKLRALFAVTAVVSAPCAAAVKPGQP